MATYAIGDIQGCFAELCRLLDKINFDPIDDVLWVCGDLVNRGPDSLRVLRLLKSFGMQHKIVLGNHDLHLLARAKNVHPGFAEDTLDKVLKAVDCEELITWLSKLPLLEYDAENNFIMTHAGVAPVWDMEMARKLALEVEKVLQSERPHFFLQNLYGDTPILWQDSLVGVERLRCITNYFTRMRYCNADGSLNFAPKANSIPWFKLSRKISAEVKILFGHWAALSGKADAENVYALDTGCVWGYCLTALCLESFTRISVPCNNRG